MPSYPVNHSLYVLLWNKYKPVLVKLMRDSEQAPQEYQFIPHEFRDLNAKEKGGHSFTLEAHRGRAINNIKMSVVAQDLIEILAKSATAYELMESAIYEFKMDKQYMLTVTKKELKKEEPAEDSASQEVTKEVKEKEEA
ncbi:hypothetical protein [Ekhidna sp.]|uniref:hypothetical protein n=1 Tax=Ekhidna sp. TaxID=2608089 RepID=UPI00351308E2